MKPLKCYDNAKVIADAPKKLPPGGYIIEIQKVELNQASWGEVLDVKFDICEGEYKDFYKQQYEQSQFENKNYKGKYLWNVPKDDGTEQDGWTANRFKSNIAAIEESNKGYKWDWDETKLVGKKVGAIFFEKEYDFEGKRGMFTTLHSFRSIDAINNGKFKIPKPKMLPPKENTYTEIAGEPNEDLPF